MNKILLYMLPLPVLWLSCSAANLGAFYNRKMNSNPVPTFSGDLIGSAYGNGWIFASHRVTAQTASASMQTWGSACSYSILMLAAFGDSSIEAAKQNGNIKQVATVEHENVALLFGFLFHKHCTIVTGA